VAATFLIKDIIKYLIFAALITRDERSLLTFRQQSTARLSTSKGERYTNQIWHIR
jgi:hypothetical protein